TGSNAASRTVSPVPKSPVASRPTGGRTVTGSTGTTLPSPSGVSGPGVDAASGAAASGAVEGAVGVGEAASAGGESPTGDAVADGGDGARASAVGRSAPVVASTAHSARTASTRTATARRRPCDVEVSGSTSISLTLRFPPRYEEYGGGRRRRGPAFPAEGPQAGPWRLHEAPGAVRMGSRAGYGSPSSGGSRTWTSRWPVRWGTSPGGSTCSTSGTSTSCAPPAPGVSTSSSA